MQDAARFRTESLVFVSSTLELRSALNALSGDVVVALTVRSLPLGPLCGLPLALGGAVARFLVALVLCSGGAQLAAVLRLAAGQRLCAYEAGTIGHHHLSPGGGHEPGLLAQRPARLVVRAGLGGVASAGLVERRRGRPAVRSCGRGSCSVPACRTWCAAARCGGRAGRRCGRTRACDRSGLPRRSRRRSSRRARSGRGVAGSSQAGARRGGRSVPRPRQSTARAAA